MPVLHVRIKTVARVVPLLCVALQTAIAFWYVRPRACFTYNQHFQAPTFAICLLQKSV